MIRKKLFLLLLAVSAISRCVSQEVVEQGFKTIQYKVLNDTVKGLLIITAELKGKSNRCIEHASCVLEIYSNMKNKIGQKVLPINFKGKKSFRQEILLRELGALFAIGKTLTYTYHPCGAWYDRVWYDSVNRGNKKIFLKSK